MSLASRLSRHAARAIALGVASLLLAGSVRAQTWNETVDAGPLPATAQHTTGPGALTTINGNLDTATDVDMYCIRIASTVSFSARLSCSSPGEDDLWLFNAGGLGVTAFTSCQGGNVSLSSAFVPSTGTYFLAVSADGAVPRAGASGLWLAGAGFNSERAPDGPGAGLPVDNWGGSPALFQVPYSLRLTGCTYCDAAVLSPDDAWGRIKVLYR